MTSSSRVRNIHHYIMYENILKLHTMDPNSIMFYDDEWISYNDDGTYQIEWSNDNCKSEVKMEQLGVWWNKTGIIEYFVKPPTSSTNALLHTSFDNANLKLRKFCDDSQYSAKQLYLIVDYTNPQFTVDTYKYIRAKNYTIVSLPPGSEQDTPTRSYLFKAFNRHIQNKHKKYNGDIIRAMDDFCEKTEVAFFVKGIDTFFNSFRKHYDEKIEIR
nr:uncharacterized protein LOC117153905 [Bombus vancouverensis nearcticus]